MAKVVPKLNLNQLTLRHHRSCFPVSMKASPSSDDFFSSPELLESSFKESRQSNTVDYNAKLQELTEGKDYKLLYRLSSEGQLWKVVRRLEYGGVDLKHLPLEHQQSVLKPKLTLKETNLDLKVDQKRSTSQRKNSSFGDAKSLNVVKRISSSENILLAKRILSTTLSLEYGGNELKTIKPNSSVLDFLAYYKNRRQRHFPSRQSSMEKKDALPPVNISNPGIHVQPIQLKYVKTNNRLGRVLGTIEASRPGVMSRSKGTASIGSPEKSLIKIAASVRRKQSSKLLFPPNLSRIVTFSDFEETMNETQTALQPLKSRTENMRSRLSRQFSNLTAELSHSLISQIELGDGGTGPQNDKRVRSNVVSNLRYENRSREVSRAKKRRIFN